MDAAHKLNRSALLDDWMTRKRPAGARIGRVQERPSGLRFAFYGRMSTTRCQDRATSQAWQREAAELLISGHGDLVVEFFDVGCSRRLPWSSRPEAAAMLAELSSPERRFDAVVVGEYERAFAGDQFGRVMGLLERSGVQMWLPEASGRGTARIRCIRRWSWCSVRSLSVRCCARHRVLAAMRAQVCERGRYLGGRPPYGYRLVDAGPHPNRAHASWGRQLRRLEPDPATAPTVRWMFAQRLAGRSMAGIARELTEHEVVCPGAADPQRNQHRQGAEWTLQTVAAILGNPRYTGRQVWNRQESSGRRSGTRDRRTVQPGEWAVSVAMAHPALVSEAEVVAVQHVRAARPTQDGQDRGYLLSGLPRCGVCGRRMDSHWAHGRAGYRCRHGRSSSRPRLVDGAKYVYVREDKLVSELVLAQEQLVEWEVEPSNGDVTGTLNALRSAGLFVVHDGRAWHFARSQSA